MQISPSPRKSYHLTALHTARDVSFSHSLCTGARLFVYKEDSARAWAWRDGLFSSEEEEASVGAVRASSGNLIKLNWRQLPRLLLFREVAASIASGDNDLTR